MTNNEISTALPNEAIQNLNACQTCGAEWMVEQDICPWCGADRSGTQILPYQFPFPQIEEGKSRWSQTRPVSGGKAVVILLLAAVFGAILYWLLPVILAVSTLVRMVILVLLIYAAASLGCVTGHPRSLSG